jgi:hypothetical protein
LTPREWQAALVRTTGFPSPDAQISEPKWWNDVVGIPSETRIQRFGGAMLTEEGTVKGGKLALNFQPDRVEWVFGAPVPSEPTLEDLPVLGPFTTASRVLSEVSLKWLEAAPPLRRLAFGAVLVQQATNIGDALRLLSKYLGSVTIDPAGTADFSYSVNRPRPSTSGIQGLTINRISKWTAGVYQAIQVNVSPGRSGTPTTHRLGPGYTACLLELDINTSPDFRTDLPAHMLLALHGELVNLANEICEKGDVP